jgi:hypothetical protein
MNTSCVLERFPVWYRQGTARYHAGVWGVGRTTDPLFLQLIELSKRYFVLWYLRTASCVWPLHKGRSGGTDSWADVERGFLP